MKIKKSPVQRFYRIALLAGAGVMIFPFFWMASSSLKDEAEAFATPPTLIPKAANLDNYRRVLEFLDIKQLFMNSLTVSISVTFLQILTASMAGYAFARLQFRGKNFFFLTYMITMMIPMQVIIVPLFIEMKYLGLIDSLVGLGLPMIASAFGTFFMRQAMAAIPKEIEEAALIDGAGHFRIFFKIAIPLTIPALSALSILAFMSVWNAFLWPLIVIFSPEKMTLPLGLANLHGQYATDWPLVMAGTTLSVIPIAVVYLLLQKRITQSFLTAGLKG
jgi:multiple sugar transport system permease protein